MKLVVITLFAVLTLLVSTPAEAGRKKTDPIGGDRPVTVLDHYLLLPGAIFPEAEIPNREKAIVVRDIANGYLKVQGHWEGFGEIALFRMTDPRRRLLGVTKASCGPACTQEIHFLEYYDGSWVERTKRILPEIPKARIAEQYRKLKHPEDPDDWGEDVPVLYLLPRNGTTIKVVVQPQFTKKEIVLFELRFDRTVFNLYAR